MFGSIDSRNMLLKPKKYQLSLFYQIKENLNNLYYLFQANKIPITKELLDYNSDYYISTILKNSVVPDASQRLVYNEIPADCKNFSTIILTTTDYYKPDIKTLKTVTLQSFDTLSLYQILNAIDAYFGYDLQLVNACLESKSIIKYDESYWFNPFHVLISLIKMYSWVPYNDYNLIGIVQNYELNTRVNLYPLCFKMLETIQYYDDMYLDKFINYHFYGLFYDKIINLDLINEWSWNKTTYTKYYTNAFGEYTFDELYNIVKNDISLDELKNMTSEMTVYNRRHVDFIKYLAVLNNLLNIKNNSKPNDPRRRFEFDITKLNNIFNINDQYNDEFRRLFGIELDKDGNKCVTGTDFLLELSTKFTDLCIRILYAREELKTLVQQYALIGTNKIITDVVRDHFVKNYTDKSTWRLHNSESLR
jgi:hypothetical protein